MLERWCGAVMPGARLRFSAYSEPRYRAALQLHIGDAGLRAAQGGVAAPRPGCPQGMDMAYVRIIVEPWVEARSHITSSALATKMEEYVPATMPANSAKAMPLSTSPPRK